MVNSTCSTITDKTQYDLLVGVIRFYFVLMFFQVQQVYVHFALKLTSRLLWWHGKKHMAILTFIEWRSVTALTTGRLTWVHTCRRSPSATCGAAVPTTQQYNALGTGWAALRPQSPYIQVRILPTMHFEYSAFGLNFKCLHECLCVFFTLVYFSVNPCASVPASPDGLRVLSVSPRDFCLRWLASSGCDKNYLVQLFPAHGSINITTTTDNYIQVHAPPHTNPESLTKLSCSVCQVSGGGVSVSAGRSVWRKVGERWEREREREDHHWQV